MKDKELRLKKYSKAPLPFVGQKRNFLRKFNQLLDENIAGNGEGWVIVDAFGGSGLLSHNAKMTKPGARVIYNDFDDYSQRLQHIESTNRLRRKIAQVITGRTNSRLDAKTSEVIINIVKNHDGFVDVQCLQSWLLFAGEQAKHLDDFYTKRLYNCMCASDYESAEGYLDGVEVVKQSYHELLPEFIDRDKTLLVLDPPYLTTNQDAYKNAWYFGIVEFVNLISMIRSSFILFSNAKSEAGAYIDNMIARQFDNYEVFQGYGTVKLKANMNYSTKYEDCMFYKFDSAD